MNLSLRVLGGFALTDGSGAPLTLQMRKTRALLAYVAVNADRSQPRERLMGLLWSDRGEKQARQSLNQALREIRRLSGTNALGLLDSDSEQVMLIGDTLKSDVQEFLALAKTNPIAAANLYGGSFLDGLSVPDPAFDDWVRSMRSELHAVAVETFSQAAALSMAGGDPSTAIAIARKLVALDPLREESHRALMFQLHEVGDRSAALRQYQTLADILNRELQVEPDATSKALFENIRHDISSRYIAAEARPSRVIQGSSRPLNQPSLVVLPFDGLGGDETAAQIADGLVADLITALARVRGLFIVGWNTSRYFTGRLADAKGVAEALGVRYVLEGSIQKAGEWLRCSVQLVDTASGHHLWAERFDKQVEDTFALQDEIVWHILIELQVVLTEGEGARVASRGTRNLQAWLLRVQATEELGKYTRKGTIRARPLFEGAHRVDPNWASPLAGIAFTHYVEARFGWSASREASIASAIDFAERAIAIDPDETFAYVALRAVHVLLGNYEKALSFIEKAVSLAPNDQITVGNLAVQLLYMDDARRAVDFFERTKSLGPDLPNFFKRAFAMSLQLVGQTDRAIEVLEKRLETETDWTLGLTQLAACYVDANQIEEARGTVQKILEHDPRYTITRYLAIVHFQNPERTEQLRTLLLTAGMPE